MSQILVTGEAKIRDIQGPVVANSGVITALDGAASQYVRGDGTLADFPTSSGGGSSVSYYLNSSVSQGTIGGVAYRELSKEPIIGAGTDIAISSNGYVASYLTDANDPDVILIPGGNFNCEFYFSVNNNTGNPFFYAELYKYDGTTFTLLGSSVGVPEYITQGTVINPYYFAIPVATAALALTDRLAIRIYVNVAGRTVTLHTENGHLCQVVTTLSKGMVSLNNLTDQSQFLTTGTSGTNFAIVSTGDTHTFNLPVASAANTGKLSSTDWSTFNNKQAALSFTAPLVNTSNTISIPAATSLVDGYLDNLDWTNFNTAYNNMIVSAAVTGTTTKTLTLNQQDGGTITASWTDDNTDAVTSVFGRTGAVVAVSGDYNTSQVTENTNLYFTDARSRAALSFTAGSGAYNSTTGVITIPTNNNQITNGSNFITLTSLSAGAGISYNNTTGAISSTITQYTDALARAAISLTTTGTSGAATYNSTTGVLNVPNYAPDLSGYVPTSRTITINGTSFDLSANRTYSVGTVTSVGLSSATSGVTIGSTPITTSGTITLAIATASGSQNGLLSSTDWTTFNNKQNALTNPVTGSGTTNYLPKFTGASTIGNSLLVDSGTNLTYSGEEVIINKTGGAFLTLLSGNTDTQYIQFKDSGGATGAIFYNHTNDSLTLKSGGNNSLILASTGAATFSSSVTLSASDSRLLGGDSSGRIVVSNSNTSSYLTMNGASNATPYQVVLGVNSINALTLASTGAATFSSSVTASGLTLLGPTGAGTGPSLVWDRIGGYGSFNATYKYESAFFTNGSTLQFQAGNGIIPFRMAVNNAATAGNIHLFPDGGGNVIVNDTADSGNPYKLQTRGSILVKGNVNDNYSFYNGVYASSTSTIYSQFTGNWQSSNNWGIGSKGTSDSTVYIGNVSSGVINPSGTFTLNICGNVLIGTTTDSGYKLDVNGGSTNGALFYSTSAANQIKAAGTAPAITFTNTITSPTIGGALGAATTANQFITGTAAGDVILLNQFTGNKLYITNYSGGVYLTQGATSWTANSDIRLKNINSHIENAVEKLSTLQTINFCYKNDKTNKQNLGLIAQEVEKIFPELIDKDGEDMLGVRYTELVPVLIKAIQELKAEIDELKIKNK
jgi:hypothetical protein